MTQENLFLCMGSACHQLGVYEVLPQIQSLLREYQLEDKIVLKGSFCLEMCSAGISMKFGDRHFTNISPQNIQTKFRDEILPSIQAILPCP